MRLLLNVLVTQIPEVLPLRVTTQVLIQLVEENAGDELGVIGQRQLVWQFGHLTTNFQDLF